MSRTCCRENFLFFPIDEIYNNTNENLGLNRVPQPIYIYCIIFYIIILYIIKYNICDLNITKLIPNTNQ